MTRRTVSSEPCELTCCSEDDHADLLVDLEHDALEDADIHNIIGRARLLLLSPAAPVPWWAA